MREPNHSVTLMVSVIGVVLLTAAFALGFTAIEPPGYPHSTDTPCGRVFVRPLQAGTCRDLIVKQSAWVIGLGVPGALALLLRPIWRAERSKRRRVLALTAIGAALGAAVVALIGRGPTRVFGAAAGALVLPGVYFSAVWWRTR